MLNKTTFVFTTQVIPFSLETILDLNGHFISLALLANNGGKWKEITWNQLTANGLLKGTRGKKISCSSLLVNCKDWQVMPDLTKYLYLHTLYLRSALSITKEFVNPVKNPLYNKCKCNTTCWPCSLLLENSMNLYGSSWIHLQMAFHCCFTVYKNELSWHLLVSLRLLDLQVVHEQKFKDPLNNICQFSSVG